MRLETRRRITTVTLVLLALIPMAAIGAVPPMEHQFWGEVTIDGAAAPDGVLVEAKIDGVTYETEYTVDGKYGQIVADLFKVPADDPDTTDIEGGVNGDTVEFYVGTVLATPTYVFENGIITELDLDVSTAIYELQLYEGWNLIGIPCIPADPSIDVMLADIIDYVESVWTYDTETGYWFTYSPGAPSDLTTMVDGKGYWIKMTADMVWEIDMA